MPKAIILDMDGVVLDSEPVRNKVHRALAKEFGYELKKEDWLDMRGKTAEANARRLLARCVPGTSLERFLKRKDEIFDSVKKGIGAFPGFEGFMKRIKGYRVALATSSTKRNAEELLKQCGIRHYFKVIVTGNDVENGKPHPECFLKAAETLGAKPEECVVVEDSVNGVRAAKAAGMYAIAVTTSHSKEELQDADIITRDIGSITPKMIKSLGGES